MIGRLAARNPKSRCSSECYNSASPDRCRCSVVVVRPLLCTFLAWWTASPTSDSRGSSSWQQLPSWYVWPLLLVKIQYRWKAAALPIGNICLVSRPVLRHHSTCCITLQKKITIQQRITTSLLSFTYHYGAFSSRSGNPARFTQNTDQSVNLAVNKRIRFPVRSKVHGSWTCQPVSEIFLYRCYDTDCFAVGSDFSLLSPRQFGLFRGWLELSASYMYIDDKTVGWRCQRASEGMFFWMCILVNHVANRSVNWLNVQQNK